MNIQTMKLIAVIIILFVPSILLYLRSFIISFIKIWRNRTGLCIETIGDLMNEIKFEMRHDITASFEFPFILPFISIFTLAIVIVFDIIYVLMYIIKKICNSYIVKSLYKYVIKIPVKYCINTPWNKIKHKLESIKEKIYNIHI